MTASDRPASCWPDIRLWLCLLCVLGSAQAEEPAVKTSIGLELVRIPAGEFQMGSEVPAKQLVRDFAMHRRKPDFFVDEHPRHRVRITQPFLMGKHEVTVGQFREFVEATGYRTAAETDGTGAWGYNPETRRCEGRVPEFNWQNAGFEQSDDHPVLNVTWHDAVAFCRWLSSVEGRNVRLPTEAEWEYACRAGTTTYYSVGNDPEKLLEAARVLKPTAENVRQHVQDLEIPPDGEIEFTVPVGKFPANAFGLHDMHGNVWEWTSDWHGDDYYAASPVDDPNGPDKGRVRVRRGGAWNSFPLWARSSFRNWNSEDNRCLNLGFRVVAELLPQEKSVSVLFVGDVMLDAGPGNVIANGGDPFAACAELLNSADVSVCNLECVVGRGGEQLLKNYVFRAAKGSVPIVKKHFDAVSLANNHSGDYGPQGLVASLQELEREKLSYFGAGRNAREARLPLIVERNGRRIALLGYNGFNMAEYAAKEDAPGSAPMEQAKMIADIQAARKKHQADIVIPYLHWGREMSPAATKEQRQLARALIDAGASAVVGAHPHVTQTVDVYQGRPIVYSLGNFVFDYYPVDPPEWTGWVLKLTFDPKGHADFELDAVTLDGKGVPHPVEEE